MPERYDDKPHIMWCSINNSSDENLFSPTKMSRWWSSKICSSWAPSRNMLHALKAWPWE